MYRVERTIFVPDTGRQARLKKAFAALGETEERPEQYCKYALVVKRGEERLVIKQYNNGKLQVQGRAQSLLPDIESILGLSPGEATPAGADGAGALGYPQIGTDESGKGDYFGPLVVAGVLVDEVQAQAIMQLGVKDSKALPDTRVTCLARRVRELLGPAACELVLRPPTYNRLYDEFRSEGKNLNHLLAWAHARVIEDLARQAGDAQVAGAITDQFGDESYVASRLSRGVPSLRLLQEPRAERYLSVAAASVLARDRFLRELRRLEEETGGVLPRGAGARVLARAAELAATGGRDILDRTAKLHYRTTDQALRTQAGEEADY